MLYDAYQRQITYLRISVTDRCNHRCCYCMPSGGVPLKRHEDILRLEELAEIAASAVDRGIRKIKLTGGEPLMRRNLAFLVREIARLPNLDDFGMTTNGSLLSAHAQELKDLGLHRVNISLCSLDPDRYTRITRGGNLEHTLAGIDAALAAGFNPVKINVVFIPGLNDRERAAFLAFGQRSGTQVRFIPKMTLADGTRGIIECFSDSTAGRCAICDRLRLTCDGILKPCLFSDIGIDVRTMGIEAAFAMVLAQKPARGEINRREFMYQIGG